MTRLSRAHRRFPNRGKWRCPKMSCQQVLMQGLTSNKPDGSIAHRYNRPAVSRPFGGFVQQPPAGRLFRLILSLSPRSFPFDVMNIFGSSPGQVQLILFKRGRSSPRVSGVIPQGSRGRGFKDSSEMLQNVKPVQFCSSCPALMIFILGLGSRLQTRP